jgi:hypothetical protein
LGLKDTVEGIVGKIPEIADNLKELSEDKQFQTHLGQAGAIGGLCLIGLDIAKIIKKNSQTPQKTAFAALLKIIFQSTMEALPDSDSLKLKDIKTEDLLSELLSVFRDSRYNWNLYLPNHPIIVQYREHLSDMLVTNYHYASENLSSFFIKFNTILEDKAIADPDVKEFYKRSRLEELGHNLKQYLEYIRSKQYDLNPVDRKSFMNYYVKSRSFLVPKDTWDKEDEDVDFEEHWTVESFLQGKEHWHIIIGAPFGIGKTSLAKHITVDYATKYLNDPGSVHIPILVLLKDTLKNVFRDNNLDYVLDSIIAPDVATKERKILLICDGLDEYTDNIKCLLEKLEKKHVELHNLKLIITTRLKAGLPDELKINE